MAQIFISYRRSDTAYVAATLNDKLQQHFGPDSVFFDVDNIPLGVDFRHYIESAVGQCDVLLVVIGDQWSGATDNSGKRRIDNPSDFVRVEIEAALKRNIPVIPVLVGEARMPSSTDLPPSIEKIAFRNAAEIRAGRDLRQHIEHLIRGLERIFAMSASAKQSDEEPVAEAINTSGESSDDVLPLPPVIPETPVWEKEETLSLIEEGMVVEGQITTLTDYGAFVDVRGVVGLLHVTDMSWGRLQDPAELFSVGDTVQAKVLKFDREHERVLSVTNNCCRIPGQAWTNVFPLARACPDELPALLITARSSSWKMAWKDWFMFRK
ncbi:MAG TPA: S1 RNA-binding domain-containing protein [Pyrinomonadaceae bacterium]|jgi:hypothetical protein|nr:S1 RNA-binding domain-containing protein [Pyrinomonadaceae bacterium]